MFQKVKLGELCTLRAGSAFKTHLQGNKTGRYPFIKVSDMNLPLNEVCIREANNWIEEGVRAEIKAKPLPPGTTVFAKIGEALKHNRVRLLVMDTIVDNNMMGAIPNQSAVDPKFFYYLLSDFDIAGTATGTALPYLTVSTLVESTFRIPSLPIQRRIAGILSAYDELIENSQRRIKILESMARALYREWFVNFRFPGHESVPRVPSPLGEIPQGWEVRPVASSFDISGGGTPSRKDERYWDGGTIQWFSPSDLTGAGTMFMDDSSDHITDRGLAESSARLFPARSVMLTSRATIGALAINTREACTNQGFITCLPNERVPLFFLFHWLKENVATFQRMASGATFKEISRGVFKTIEFLQPTRELTEKFEVMAEPLGEQLLTLQRQIQNLRRTRDLLLPRLLSGQIDVLPHDGQSA